MTEVLARFEATPFSTWLRETTSLFGFQIPLVLHVLGMAMLAGTSFAIALRLLGVAPGIPRPALRSLYPLLIGGFVLNLLSGLLLLAAYPTKAFTNPLFYVKLALVAASLAAMAAIRRHGLTDAPAPRFARLLAGLSIAGWTATIIFARLLAYTYHYLLAGVRGGF